MAIAESLFDTCFVCNGTGYELGKQTANKCQHCEGTGQFIYNDVNRAHMMMIKKSTFKKYKTSLRKNKNKISRIEDKSTQQARRQCLVLSSITGTPSDKSGAISSSWYALNLGCKSGLLAKSDCNSVINSSSDLLTFLSTLTLIVCDEKLPNSNMSLAVFNLTASCSECSRFCNTDIALPDVLAMRSSCFFPDFFTKFVFQISSHLSRFTAL